MKKQLPVLTLSLLLLLALCACGDPQEAAPAEETAEAAVQVEEDKSVSEPDTEPEAQAGDLLYQQYNIITFEVTPSQYDAPGFVAADVKMTNNSEGAVTRVSPVVDFLDADGNILVTTYPQLQSNLRPGASATEQALVDASGFDASLVADIVVDNYSYHTVGWEEDLYVDVNTLAMKAAVYQE